MSFPLSLSDWTGKSMERFYYWGNIAIFRSALTLSLSWGVLCVMFHSVVSPRWASFSWRVNLSHHPQKVVQQHQPVNREQLREEERRKMCDEEPEGEKWRTGEKRTKAKWKFGFEEWRRERVQKNEGENKKWDVKTCGGSRSRGKIVKIVTSDDFLPLFRWQEWKSSSSAFAVLWFQNDEDSWRQLDPK